MRVHRQQHFRSVRLIACGMLMLLAISSMAVIAQSNQASNAQQAAQVALEQTGGGKVLGVSTETDSQGRRVFAVKVLSANGRVRIVRIPQT